MKRTRLFISYIDIDKQINEFLETNGADLIGMVSTKFKDSDYVLISYSIPGEKKKKEKKAFIPPTREEMAEYAHSQGHYRSVGLDAWKYYNNLKWKDKNDKPVLNWKAKMLSTWLKDENKMPQQAPAKPEETSPYPNEYLIYVKERKALGMNFLSFEEWTNKPSAPGK